MSKNRRNGHSHTAKVHANMLHNSEPDLVQLGSAVEERFKKLTHDWYVTKHEMLLPDADYEKDMFLWRQMRVRHLQLDYRNTDDEKKATRRIAEWTHEFNCQLREQVYTPLQWKD